MNNVSLHKITTIPSTDENYPKEFLAIEGYPPIIYAMGDSSLLKSPSKVAIIGARAADVEGNKVAYNLGVEYAQKGYAVVSGLALGCDTAAHEGCMDGGGKTIAIVATGLDLTHPKENQQLQERILSSGGVLISEQPLGVKANPTRLVARNRLQAALSEMVIVAQCPIKSGTIHTVNFAARYGKPIYAWRYSRQNEFNSGNFELLKKGIAKQCNITQEI